MKKEVKKYFVDLQKSEIKKKSGAIVLNDNADQQVKYGVTKRIIAGKPFYQKNSVQPKRATASIASAEMYTDMGIITPPPFVVLTKDIYTGKKQINTVTQDLNSLQGFSFTPASKVLGYALIDAKINKKGDKWAILKDEKTRAFFLQFMTPDCLNELVNVYLLDELRTDSDRHIGNYFFYKSPSSDLYQGLALIDLDMVEVLIDRSAHSKNGFREFVYTKYDSFLPTNDKDKLSHSERMQRIADLLNSGDLSRNNIATLKSAISYDLEGTVKSIHRDIKPIRDKKAYDALSRLWEYNRNTIGKELGL